MNLEALESRIADRMLRAEVSQPAIQSFISALRRAVSGEKGLIPEASIDPIPTPPRISSLGNPAAMNGTLLSKLAVIKLNGGLGTGMGLDRAKSLLPVKSGLTFLDFMARQILWLREKHGVQLPFLLMNSFNTQRDSLEYLAKYPSLPTDGRIDFLQSKAPKLLADSFEPATWPEDPELEWCPPGHGDIYPSLLSSGTLDSLLTRGVEFLFISNSDNLGATVDARLLQYFAESGLSFLMEVCEKTPADKKGGHPARRRSDGRLVLRDTAQCPKEELADFENISRHCFYNTNNLWIRVDRLREELAARGGYLPLPLIRNEKTVDPVRKDSAKVLQLESAMGAAIECFERSGIMCVNRERFSPVKNTSDLLALRSDAYVVGADFRVELHPDRQGIPPLVELDQTTCKFMSDFEKCFPEGAPSLLRTKRFKADGALKFRSGVHCLGEVEFHAASGKKCEVHPGLYASGVFSY